MGYFSATPSGNMSKGGGESTNPFQTYQCLKYILGALLPVKTKVTNR